MFNVSVSLALSLCVWAHRLRSPCSADNLIGSSGERNAGQTLALPKSIVLMSPVVVVALVVIWRRKQPSLAIIFIIFLASPGSSQSHSLTQLLVALAS